MLFIKLFKPVSSSLRFKKKVSSSMSSKLINCNIKLQFFKKRVYNNHKFLSNTNSIFKLNCTNPISDLYLIINYFKVSYKNIFLGFCKSFDGSIFIKKLCYGFSMHTVHSNLICKNSDIYKILLKYYIIGDEVFKYHYIIDICSNFKFFSLCIFNKKYLIANSAGSFCSIINKDFYLLLCNIKLPSKKCKFIDFLSTAYYGRCSNVFAKFHHFSTYSSVCKIKKKHVKVRGVAKNPVDHPNGGRSKVKKPFLNPWGKIAKNNK